MLSVTVFNHLKIVSGDIYGVVLPDPIPNSEVKHARADDSTAHAAAKVGSCPLVLKPPLQGGFFIVFKYGVGLFIF